MKGEGFGAPLGGGGTFGRDGGVLRPFRSLWGGVWGRVGGVVRVVVCGVVLVVCLTPNQTLFIIYVSRRLFKNCNVLATST